MYVQLDYKETDKNLDVFRRVLQERLCRMSSPATVMVRFRTSNDAEHTHTFEWQAQLGVSTVQDCLRAYEQHCLGTNDGLAVRLRYSIDGRPLRRQKQLQHILCAWDDAMAATAPNDLRGRPASVLVLPGYPVQVEGGAIYIDVDDPFDDPPLLQLGLRLSQEESSFPKLCAAWDETGDANEVLVTGGDDIPFDLSRSDILHLRRLEWLNDNLIEFVLRRVSLKGIPGVMIMNTFFYAKLAETSVGYCYANVRRWTCSPSNVFAHRAVLVPLHVGGNHWTVILIDIHNRSMTYYDSLRGQPPTNCEQHLKHWLFDERGKSDSGLVGRVRPSPPNGDWAPEWGPLCLATSGPLQHNASDCGMHCLLTIGRLALGRGLGDVQHDAIDTFRRDLALALLDTDQERSLAELLRIVCGDATASPYNER